MSVVLALFGKEMLHQKTVFLWLACKIFHPGEFRGIGKLRVGLELKPYLQ